MLFWTLSCFQNVVYRFWTELRTFLFPHIVESIRTGFRSSTEREIRSHLQSANLPRDRKKKRHPANNAGLAQ
jgi:hypothetical protein